jgi:hypothetical protein
MSFINTKNIRPLKDIANYNTKITKDEWKYYYLLTTIFGFFLSVYCIRYLKPNPFLLFPIIFSLSYISPVLAQINKNLQMISLIPIIFFFDLVSKFGVIFAFISALIYADPLIYYIILILTFLFTTIPFLFSSTQCHNINQSINNWKTKMPKYTLFKHFFIIISINIANFIFQSTSNLLIKKSLAYMSIILFLSMGCYLILQQAIDIKSLIFELIERRVNREY